MRLKDYASEGLGGLDDKTHKYLFEGIDGKEYGSNPLMQQLLSDVPSPSFMSRDDWAADGGKRPPLPLPYPRATLTQFFLGGPGTGAQVRAVRSILCGVRISCLLALPIPLPCRLKPNLTH
jgi:hypothetical protein